MTSPVTLARADVAKLLPQLKSAEERWWDTHGALIIGNEFDSAVVATYYEKVSFKVPGGSYTPDFMHVLADGRMVYVEVKALILKTKIIDRRDGTSEVKQVHNSRAQHGYREARSKLRAAAECYPFYIWVEARVGKRGEHELEIINP